MGSTSYPKYKHFIIDGKVYKAHTMNSFHALNLEAQRELKTQGRKSKIIHTYTTDGDKVDIVYAEVKNKKPEKGMVKFIPHKHDITIRKEHLHKNRKWKDMKGVKAKKEWIYDKYGDLDISGREGLKFGDLKIDGHRYNAWVVPEKNVPTLKKKLVETGFDVMTSKQFKKKEAPKGYRIVLQSVQRAKYLKKNKKK